MRKHWIVALLFTGLLTACNAQPEKSNAAPLPEEGPRLLEEVFVSDSSVYAQKAREMFARLSDAERVAQLIMTTGGRLGKSQDTIVALVEDGIVGGSIYLADSLETHRAQVGQVEAIGQVRAQVPLWFAIDAEPSLLARRIIGAPTVPATSELNSTVAVREVAARIDSLIRALGYHWNYAPVVDLSTGNAAIKNRSFGSDESTVVQQAIAYVEQTQADGVLACVKHFPGHGLVEGDTHKGSVYIDGAFKEYEVYEQLLAKSDPLSLMVGHITVLNNEYATDDLPASLSRRITTDLIRGKLGYEGLVVTDALNMMAAATKYGPTAPLMASKAGADVILMPADERLTHRLILEAMQEDEAYRGQVYRSVDRVLRAKAWLNLY